jgi:nucleoside permease NupC
MGSKGKKKARKPSHSQHLPKVGTATENNRLLHEEQHAVLDQMGVGGASSGLKIAFVVIAVLLVGGAIISLLALTAR